MAPAPRYSPSEEESLILDSAAKCVRESSILDFKMSAIAAEAGISMGSIYKHVQSKEDVLVALATREMAFAHRITADVMAMSLSGPERLVSNLLLHPMKIHKEPFGVHLEMLIGNEAVLKRASPRWLDKLAILDHSIEGIVTDALNADDGLQAKGAKRAALIEELMIGLWSMHVGFVQVAFQQAARQRGELSTPLPFPLAINHGLVNAAMHLINSYPWAQPLTRAGIKAAAWGLESLGYR